MGGQPGFAGGPGGKGGAGGTPAPAAPTAPAAPAANIVREEAAKYGATTESSLFNESAKRDYDVQGNGYEFRLLQIKFATLNITGDCFLLQKVLDLPAGQLPPEPPIWPTTSTPH